MRFPLIFPLLPLLPGALAWSCENVALEGATYDFSPLKGTHMASKKRDTPPTTTEDRVRFDICGEIEREDGNDNDQCPKGTNACLTLINHKEGADPVERVTAVIPMWSGEEPDVAKVDDGVRLTIKAGDYAGTQQNFDLTLKCADSASDPIFESYTDGVLKLEWKTPTACASGDKPESGDGDKGDGEKKEEGASWGFFSTLNFLFWTAFFLLAAYFVIGIVYNHQQYSARGWDLVPHRDFWREMPALARDLGSHLASNVRQSTGRGGYSSLG